MGRREANGAFKSAAGYGEGEGVCDRPKGEPGEKFGEAACSAKDLDVVLSTSIVTVTSEAQAKFAEHQHQGGNITVSALSDYALSLVRKVIGKSNETLGKLDARYRST